MIITLLTVLAWIIFGGWALIGLGMLIWAIIAQFAEDFTLGERAILLVVSLIPSLVNILIPVVLLLVALHFIPLIPLP